MRLFADNPLIERYRFSSLRPKQCWVYGFIFTTIILIMMMVNLAMYIEHGTYDTAAELYTGLYYQFFALLFLILCVFSSTSTSGALREEFAERSYDFFRMLPLPAHYKAVGIMLGRNLLNLIMAALLAIMTTFVGVAGGVSPGLILQMLFCVLALALFFNCMSLFSAINPNRKTGAQSSQTVGVVAALLLIFPFLIYGMMAITHGELEIFMVSFYFARIPILIFIACLAIYLSIWLYLGICRKFDNESEPVMTKSGAPLFLAGGIVIFLGLFGPHMDGDESFSAVAAYWATTFLIAVLLPPGFSLTRQRYMEMRSLNAAMPLPQFLLRFSNLSICVLLYAMWAVPALIAAFFAAHPIPNAGVHVLNLLLFYLIFCGLVELMATTDPMNNRLKTLLAFIGILYVFLPLIVAAALSSGTVFVFSILGYFFVILDHAPLQETPEVFAVLGVNLCFATLLWVFINGSYRELFPARGPSRDPTVESGDD